MGNALYFHRCELFTSFRNIPHIDEKSYAGFSNALCYRLVVFFHPYFVLFNSQVDELKKSQTFPSQRQTQIIAQVFKMFHVCMHTLILFSKVFSTFLRLRFLPLQFSVSCRMHERLFEFRFVSSDLLLRKSLSN